MMTINKFIVHDCFIAFDGVKANKFMESPLSCINLLNKVRRNIL